MCFLSFWHCSTKYRAIHMCYMFSRLWKFSVWFHYVFQLYLWPVQCLERDRYLLHIVWGISELLHSMSTRYLLWHCCDFLSSLSCWAIFNFGLAELHELCYREIQSRNEYEHVFRMPIREI